MRVNQPGYQAENSGRRGDGGDTTEEDFHGGRITEETTPSGPGDLGTGLHEEAKLDGGGTPCDQAGLIVSTAILHSVESDCPRGVNIR